MDLERLRSETRVEHEATEAVLPLMSNDLTLAGYRSVLERFRAVMQAWDAWSAANTPGRFAALMAARRRTALINADLAVLSVQTDGPTSALHSHLSPGLVLDLPLRVEPAKREAAFLGALYVVEGSTLGGQYIARHLEETLGLTREHGAAFFVGYGAETGRRWNEVKAEIVAVDERHADAVIAVARAVFQFFRAHLAEAP